MTIILSFACEGDRSVSLLRKLLLFLALTATVAHGLAQPVAPRDKPASAGTPSTAMPDFSGTWSHPYLTGFEIPFSGPGPVLNTQRSRNGVANFQMLVGDYKNPILQPWAAEVVKQHGEISLAGKGYPTPSNQCWPGGVPYVFWDFLLQMFQQGDHITMVYRHGNEVRRVRLNDSHPAHLVPSWYGDSVGHYEDDTLIIDTVGIKVGPFAMVDMYGTPHTEALHVVERYRLIDYAAATEAIVRNDKENFYVRQDSFDPQLSGQGAAACIHRRGSGRLHDAVVVDDHLSAQFQRMDGPDLRREPP